MLTTVVITIVGADRPGLVEAVSACVTSHGGNWLESRLLRMGGQFAGIVRIEVEEKRRPELLGALHAPLATGLNVIVHDADAGPPDQAGEPVVAVAAMLEVVGHDRPGIVREISRALAARRVNVEELSTERASAPMSGEPIFQARAKITLPAGVEPGALRRDLEKIAGDLMVNVSLSAEGANT